MIRVAWPLPGPFVWVRRTGAARRGPLSWILAPIVVSLWLVATVVVLVVVGFRIGWQAVRLYWVLQQHRTGRQQRATQQAARRAQWAQWADYWDMQARANGWTGPNPYREPPCR